VAVIPLVVVAMSLVVACASGFVAVERTIAVTAQRPEVAPPFVVYVEPPGRPPLRDQVYARRGTTALTYDVTYPRTVDDASPVVVLLHGGGWWSGDVSDMRGIRGTPAAIAAAGFVAVSANYRLACHGPARGDATAPAASARPDRACGVHVADQVEDVRSLLRHLRSRAALLHIDPDRMAILGISAGGHLGLLTAATARRPAESVHAVVNWSGAPSVEFIEHQPLQPASSEFSLRAAFENVVGCDFATCPAAWEWASPASHLTPATPRFAVFSVVGERESQVPVEPVQAFHRRLDELGFPNEYALGPGTCHAASCANYPLAGSEHTTTLDASITFLQTQLDVPRP
jgi:acetyl esterase/lipase